MYLIDKENPKTLSFRSIASIILFAILIILMMLGISINAHERNSLNDESLAEYISSRLAPRGLSTPVGVEVDGCSITIKVEYDRVCRAESDFQSIVGKELSLNLAEISTSRIFRTLSNFDGTETIFVEFNSEFDNRLLQARQVADPSDLSAHGNIQQAIELQLRASAKLVKIMDTLGLNSRSVLRLCSGHEIVALPSLPAITVRTNESSGVAGSIQSYAEEYCRK